jgi:hypothetical protein
VVLQLVFRHPDVVPSEEELDRTPVVVDQH